MSESHIIPLVTDPHDKSTETTSRSLFCLRRESERTDLGSNCTDHNSKKNVINAVLNFYESEKTSSKVSEHQYKTNLDIIKDNLTLLKERDIVQWERKDNIKFYEKNKECINRNYEGQYVVIVNTNLNISDSYDEAKKIGMDAHHRLIFKVEPHKEERGMLGWPMKEI